MALVIDVARKAATEVADDYWQPGRFPVDVEAIARGMGLRIEYTYLRDGVSGMVRARPDQIPTIYVDRDENPSRQRFTIAHELGHFVERSNQGQPTSRSLTNEVPSTTCTSSTPTNSPATFSCPPRRSGACNSRAKQMYRWRRTSVSRSLRWSNALTD